MKHRYSADHKKETTYSCLKSTQFSKVFKLDQKLRTYGQTVLEWSAKSRDFTIWSPDIKSVPTVEWWVFGCPVSVWLLQLIIVIWILVRYLTHSLNTEHSKQDIGYTIGILLISKVWAVLHPILYGGGLFGLLVKYTTMIDTWSV